MCVSLLFSSDSLLYAIIFLWWGCCIFPSYIIYSYIYYSYIFIYIFLSLNDTPIHKQQTLSGDCPNEKDICGIGFRRHTTGIEQRGIIIIYEIGHLETCIHSVCRRVFTPARQNHFLRKLVPKIFFHFSKQRKTKQKNYGHTSCNRLQQSNNTHGTTMINI